MEQVENTEQTGQAEQAKRTFSTLGWCYLAGTVLLNILEIVLMQVVNKIHPEWLQNTDLRLVLSSVMVYGFTLPFICLLVRNLPATAPERKPIRFRDFVAFFVMGYAMLFVSNILGNIATILIGAAKGSQVDNRLLEYVTSGSVWTMMVLMVVIAPIMEELIFRKLLVDRALKYGPGLAVVLSGLVFGLFHGNLNQFAYAVVLGAFFAFIYIKTGDIRITIGLHMLVNFLGSVVASELLKQIHYTELLQAAMEDQNRMLALVEQHITGWILYGLYLIFLIGVVIAGIVLIIVNRKKFQLEPGEAQVPAGQGMQTLFLNPGMICFCVVWIILIILQLFE